MHTWKCDRKLNQVCAYLFFFPDVFTFQASLTIEGLSFGHQEKLQGLVEILFSLNDTIADVLPQNITISALSQDALRLV